MELYQLEHFVAAVEEHSFTKAAQRVFRTQGAVSVAIRKLEEEVGVPLMVRDNHECVLTEAGQTLYLYAHRIIDLRDTIQRQMLDFKNLVAGRVSIAAHESAADYLLRSPLAAFSGQHPNIKLEARLCDGDQIARLVSNREVDLGFGIRQTNLHGLASELIHEDPLVMVVPPGHRFCHAQPVRIVDLRDEKFFMHSRHTVMTMTIRRLFSDLGLPLNVAGELWNFETIKQFVMGGGGVAIIPASVAQSDVESGRLSIVRIVDLQVTRTIEVIYREKESLLPAPIALLDLLRRWRWPRIADDGEVPTDRSVLLKPSGLGPAA